jgi:hypothetical protein
MYNPFLKLFRKKEKEVEPVINTVQPVTYKNAYVLLFLTSGMKIMGQLVMRAGSDCYLRYPVVITPHKDTLYLSLLYNGMNRYEVCPISLNNVLSMTTPSDTIVDNYNNYINEIFESVVKYNKNTQDTIDPSVSKTANTLHDMNNYSMTSTMIH